MRRKRGLEWIRVWAPILLAGMAVAGTSEATEPPTTRTVGDWCYTIAVFLAPPALDVTLSDGSGYNLHDDGRDYGVFIRTPLLDHSLGEGSLTYWVLARNISGTCLALGCADGPETVDPRAVLSGTEAASTLIDCWR